MARRGENHVLEPTQHMGTDHIPLVSTRQGGNQRLACRRHAQVVRPERHQALHERALGLQPRRQGRIGLRRRYVANADPGTTEDLGVTRPLSLPQRADGLAQTVRRWQRRIVEKWGPLVELGHQPRARVPQCARFARPRAESENDLVLSGQGSWSLRRNESLLWDAEGPNTVKSAGGHALWFRSRHERNQRHSRSLDRPTLAAPNRRARGARVPR